MSKTLILFIIIFLEGYAVLSTELLAIRQLIPFTGSGTDTVSIIIAAVLMPLAFGYFSGGAFRPWSGANGRPRTVRRKLLINLSLSAIILAIGLSHVTVEIFFATAQSAGDIHNRLALTALYSLIFLLLPVFMLGQTVPLISNYFPRQRLPRFAGKILFFSTIGSFMGAVFCTLVLMPNVGVHHAVTVTIACLTFLTILISRDAFNTQVKIALCAFLLSVLLNSDMVMRMINIAHDNQYNTVEIHPSTDGTKRVMLVNNTLASAVAVDPGQRQEAIFPYIKYVDDHFIYSRGEKDPPIDILTIGAGGFTVGLNDRKNHYTFVDVDPKLKETTENLFLQDTLSDNKEFVPEEARAFLSRNDRKFDMIFLDAYNSLQSLPEPLLTKEFFEQLRDAMKPDGVLVINAVQSHTFADVFSVRFDNTLRAVFPQVTREIASPVAYSFWDRSKTWQNVMYTAFNRPKGDVEIYTDDLNPSFRDRGKPVKK